MRYKVVVSGRAREALRNAHRWILDKSKSALVADTWYSSMLQAMESLSEMPERCPIARESETFDCTIRHLVVGRKGRTFRILFEVRGDDVFVLHVRRSSQDRLDTI